MAHAVFLNTRDLSYVHTHPMALGAMTHMRSMSSTEMDALMEHEPFTRVAPDMMLHVTVHEPGTYKLWFQFQGASRLYVVPFLLHAAESPGNAQ